MKITTAALMLRYLESEGVEYIFGVPGTTMVPLYAALNKQTAIKPILAKHEEGAAFMADGYARVSGKLGVCYSTSGPGVTNLITGVATASMDNIPLLVVTGQVPTTIYGKGTYQDSTKGGVDSVAMLDPITKLSTMILSKHKVPDVLKEAFRTAFSGKNGPVHISFPKDIMDELVDDTVLPAATYRTRSEYFDRKLVIDATHKLVHAKRPAMLVGAGAVSSGAMPQILELAEMLNIPVATTPKAKGAFPESHVLSLGTLGLAGSPPAEHYLLGEPHPDVLFVIGSSLNQVVTYSWDPALRPTECMIQLNIDPTEIGKNYPADVGLVGDCAAVLDEISFRVLRELHGHDPREQRPLEEIVKFKKKVGLFVDPEKMHSTAVPLKPQAMMREMQEALPKDAIVFCDMGSHVCWGLHYLKFDHPGFISPFGLLTMGFGTAASIGGKLAAPHRPVFSLVGDGCFLMNGMEVAAAVSHDIPVIWIVQNNSRLGLVHELQRFSLGEHTVSTDFKRIDAAKVAEGLGALAFHVEKPGELAAAMRAALAANRPTVIDVIIDPDEVPPIHRWARGAANVYANLNYV
jgi:acetolactate synthase-1/2/3 large subunit